METALQPIIRSPGVIGAAIFDASGACVVDQLQPPYEPILLTEVLAQLREVNDNYLVLESGSATTAVTLKFTEGCFLMRSLGTMSLVVIAGAQANLSVVAVALNVATLKLSRALGVGPVRPAPPPIPGLANAQFAPQGMPGLPQGGLPQGMPQPGHGSYGGSSLGSSNLGTSNLGTSQLGASLGTSMSLSGEWSKKKACPPGAVGMSVMRHLLKAFLRRKGREGLNILDMELQRVGETPSTLKASQFADLISTLSRYIDDPSARAGFVAQALGD